MPPTTTAPEKHPQLLTVPGGRPDLDHDIKRVGAPARVRIPLFLYNEATTNYDNWRGVSWILAFPKVADAVAFREDMDKFVRAWVAKRQKK